MGTTRRSYLQWKEDCCKSARDIRDPRPYDLHRYCMENGKRITTRTKLLEVGTCYRGRIIRDVTINTTTSGVNELVYLCECSRCHKLQWVHMYNMGRIAENNCASCAPRDDTHLRKFVQKIPDYEPGTRIGSLTVIKSGRMPSGKSKLPSRHVLVQCDCGAEPYWVYFYNLRGGKTTRCDACAKKKSQATRQKQYWGYADICPDVQHRRRLLARISSVLQRCNNPKCSVYKHYGGRDIQCKFKDRKEFLAYLLTLDGWDNPDYDLDRTNNEGHYEPGNLRFVSRKDNVANRRHVTEQSDRISELERKVAEYEALLGIRHP